MDQTTLREVRCPKCRKLLFRVGGEGYQHVVIEIHCKCKADLRFSNNRVEIINKPKSAY